MAAAAGGERSPASAARPTQSAQSRTYGDGKKPTCAGCGTTAGSGWRARLTSQRCLSTLTYLRAAAVNRQAGSAKAADHRSYHRRRGPPESSVAPERPPNDCEARLFRPRIEHPRVLRIGRRRTTSALWLRIASHAAAHDRPRDTALVHARRSTRTHSRTYVVYVRVLRADADLRGQPRAGRSAGQGQARRDRSASSLRLDLA